MWKWFKERGGNVAILVIGLVVIVGGLIAFLTSKDYVDLGGWKKFGVIISLACALATGIAGDAVGVFAPGKESEWKGGQARWRIAIWAFFIIAIAIATSGAPLKG